MFDTTVDRGLDYNVVAHNIQRDGKNIITKSWYGFLTKHSWSILANVILVYFPALLSFISWRMDPHDPTLTALAILLIGVSVCYGLFHVFQTSGWSTRRIMSPLLHLIQSECIVICEGKTSRIPTVDLVVGDLVMLSVGNKVPADMRLVETSDDLRFDRSVLTGESEEIEGIVESHGTTFLKAPNIVLMEKHITNGCAKGVVVLTGDRTANGHISKLKNRTVEKPAVIENEILVLVLISTLLLVALAISVVIVRLARLQDDTDDFSTTFQKIFNDCLRCQNMENN
ncbi:hypothetical protein C0993_000922 [Termitomyces sp. T159_Od127]|nr:hypothetical protein C0993_000922 [Termitomyces sp. T159_Od127]